MNETRLSSVRRIGFSVDWPPGHVACYLLDLDEPVLVDAGILGEVPDTSGTSSGGASEPRAGGYVDAFDAFYAALDRPVRDLVPGVMSGIAYLERHGPATATMDDCVRYFDLT